ncbi:MAG: GIY-YIG nuclease family protein [Vicingaceae bacterium]
MGKIGCTYFISNKNRTVIYTGVTSNLEKRILRHKAGRGSVFAARYSLTDLMYYERIDGMMNAIRREKQLKRWHKAWKWNLVKSVNPELNDLAADWFSEDEINEAREMFK